MYRQEKLEHMAEKFGHKSSLRETWLTQILDELNTGCDVHTVGAAMKGHKAINTDVNVKVSC